MPRPARRTARILAVAFCSGLAAAIPVTARAAQPQLIADGTFGQPAAPASGFILFSTGQAMGAWKVVGAPGNVGLVRSGFSQGAFSFKAFTGEQFVDLTGNSNSATGIMQSVATVPGATYDLSFAVGNSFDPSGRYGTSSTVRIVVDGARYASVTNALGKGSTTIDWQLYVIALVAHRTTTTIAFINGDPITDTANALDDVSLTLANPDDRSSIASSLASIADAVGSLGHDAALLAVSGAVTLFVVFPANLFNHTFQENHDEIMAFVERRRRRISARRTSAAESHAGVGPELARAALVIVVGALLAGLLDPAFGISLRSLYAGASLVVTLVALIALSGFVAWVYRRARRRGCEFTVVAYPAGLLVAGICVLVSRLSSFEPGYLYGVIATLAFRPKLDGQEEGRVALLTALATLVLAASAWGVWGVVNHGAAGSSAPLVLLDDVLGAIVAAGLTGTVINLLPVRFLPGDVIATWSRAAWAGIFVLAVFAMSAVMLWPNRGGHPGAAPLATVIVLLVLFGGASVGLWWYFEHRQRRAGQEAGGSKVANPPAG